MLRGLIDHDYILLAWSQARPQASWGPWLAAHGLAPYTWHRLRALGCAESLPAELSQALRNAYYSSVGDTELHTLELRHVLACLAEAGVTPVLFKGAALAYTAYPDPACRPMGDLDLWVADEAMPRARAALAAAGYREHGKPDRPLQMLRQSSGEVQLVGSAPGTGLVELHWGTFAGEWVRRTAAVDDRAMTCRARQARIAGCQAWTLAPEDAVLQLAVHFAVGHQMAYPGVRGLLDVALLARSQSINWLQLAEQARAWRVATPSWLVLSLCAQLLGLPGADGAIGKLAPSARRQALLRRFVDAEYVLRGRDMTGGPRRLAFQLLLTDRLGDAVHLVARTLWPEHQWLQARYGGVGFGVRFRHLSGAMRGRL